MPTSRGAHGGFGPQETGAFALLPARTRLPVGTEDYIRPDALRLAALHHLGRAPFPASAVATVHASHLRLMTYNTHGCGGVDGRVSPRRIARELGLHAVFCPTITRGEEHYGHALLTHWPIEAINRSRLPHDPRSWWQEPRSAIWARVQVAGQPVNVVTTHLGLGARERLLQMAILLGKDWIGSIPAKEPVILCGDFNCLPRSAPYVMASRRLHDVQKGNDRRPLNTFSSIRPLVRLDHIFASAEFACLAVVVPRNDLTRVASDHLPLIADLRILNETEVGVEKRRAAPLREVAVAAR